MTCVECSARHHADCWSEGQGCATCRSARGRDPDGRAVTLSGSAVPSLESAQLEPTLRTRVEFELRSGETLRWLGQPRPGAFARRALPVALFGVPWTGFSLFWMLGAGAVTGGLPLSGGFALFKFFPLFGLPFLLLGLGMLSGPLWQRRRARRTCYAITDERVILWEANLLGGWTTRSYRPGQLGALSRRERSDGSGDLILSERSWRDHDGDLRREEQGLFGVERVRELEELLRTTLWAEPKSTSEDLKAEGEDRA